MSDWQWRGGNRLKLLENGEAYFPAVFAAIEAARHEVLIETFILFEDPVGLALEKAITRAAGRGAQVQLTVDGYGSEKLSQDFIARMQKLGVHLRMFEPFPRFLGNRVNLFRRLHRKIVVVDAQLAFVGGINFSEDHLLSSGDRSKQDYSVQVEGPLVDDIRALVLSLVRGTRHSLSWWRRWRQQAGPLKATSQEPVLALLAWRDNQHHFDDIERQYRIAIRRAQQRVVIANAYFFPGYRLLRSLKQAARRGVRVQLIMQGNPDMPMVSFITRTLYAQLARAGVEIFEYCERPIHAKVAVIDAEWATVGSSNLDPLSLALNLEANVFVIDQPFAGHLQSRLDALIAANCNRLDQAQLKNPSLLAMLLGFVAFHVSRFFPRLARRLPASRPRTQVLSPGAQALPPAADKPQ